MEKRIARFEELKPLPVQNESIPEKARDVVYSRNALHHLPDFWKAALVEGESIAAVSFTDEREPVAGWILTTEEYYRLRVRRITWCDARTAANISGATTATIRTPTSNRRT